MKILAVEFSSPQRSVALIEGAQTAGSGPAISKAPLVHAAPVLLARTAETGGRRALELIEQTLRDAKCEREDIEVIAVGIGPGSYTGIRGALALAQGWEIGRGAKLLGINSVECLAAQARASGMSGIVNIIIDAQRKEFYLAAYEIDAVAMRPIEPLRLASMAQIEELVRRGKRLIGPDITHWFSGGTNLFPDAAMLGSLASGRSDFVPGAKLEPIYLRETAFKKASLPIGQI